MRNVSIPNRGIGLNLGQFIGLSGIAKGLEQNGCQVKLIMVGGENASMHMLSTDTDRIFSVFSGDPYSFVSQPRYVLRARDYLKKIIAKDAFDLFLCQNPFCSFYAAKGLGKPIVYDIRSPWIEFLLLNWKKNLPVVKRILYYLEQKVIFNSDAVVMITNRLKEFLFNRISFETEKVFVAPSGVDTALFKPQSKEKIDVLKEQIGLENDQVIVLCTTISKIRIEPIFKALRTVFSKHHSCRFVLVGSSRKLGEIKRLARDYEIEKKIVFIGGVDHQNVPLYLSLADVCISDYLPNRPIFNVSSPLKIFEIMSCGKPIVATNIPPHSDVIKNYHNGLLANDVNEFADCVLTLLKDDGLRKQISSNNLRDREKFDWKHAVKGVVDAFDYIYEKS